MLRFSSGSLSFSFNIFHRFRWKLELRIRKYEYRLDEPSVTRIGSLNETQFQKLAASRKFHVNYKPLSIVLPSLYETAKKLFLGGNNSDLHRRGQLEHQPCPIPQPGSGPSKLIIPIPQAIGSCEWIIVSWPELQLSDAMFDIRDAADCGGEHGGPHLRYLPVTFEVESSLEAQGGSMEHGK